MSNHLREQMLASALETVNSLCTWAHDQALADFDAREEHLLQAGRALMTTWLGQLAERWNGAAHQLVPLRAPR